MSEIDKYAKIVENSEMENITMEKLICLENYFNNTKYAIYYFDNLIKQKGFKKELFLDSLNISYSTYRRARCEVSSTGEKIISDLEDYFNMSHLNKSKIKQYEDLLNDIWLRFYYRGDNLSEYENIILDLINEDNYLKPIFELFYLLISLVSNTNIKECFEKNLLVFNEIIKLKKDYFISPFTEILVMLEVSFSKNKFIEYDRTIKVSERMKGVLYYAYTLNAYLAKKYDLCLYYSTECRRYLLNDYNFKRVLSINLTYFSCLNKIGEYTKCLEEANRQMNYLKELDDNLDLYKFTLIHYYTACIGLKDYKHIIDSLYKEETYNVHTYIFLIISCFIEDKEKYNEVINKYKVDSTTSVDITKHSNTLDNLINYLNNPKKNDYIEKIKTSSLNIALKDILLTIF